MAGVTTKQGTFATATPGPTTVTGIGFTPYAIIFWVSGTGSAANDTWEQSIEDSIGFAAYDGTNYYNANNAYMVKYATTGGVYAGWGQNATSCFFIPSTSSTTALCSGHVSAVANGSFTITYDVAAAGYTVHYLAIGGDVNKACIAAMTLDATIGSIPYHQTVTLPNSLTWIPSAVLFLGDGLATTGFTYNNNGSTCAVVLFGAMDAAGNQNSSFTQADGVSSSNATVAYRSQSASYCLSAPDTHGNAIDNYLTYNAMGAGSFTVVKGGTNYASTFGGMLVYALCLYSTTANEILCGSWTSANSTTETVTTGVTTVQGALFHTDNDTAFGSNTHSRYSIGATDGTGKSCIAQTDVDAQTKNTGDAAKGIEETAKCLLIANAAATTTSTATATFSGAGIALTWSAAITNKICYVAFGSGSTNATVAMTCPGASADDCAPTVTSSSTAVLTTVPGATADDIAVTPGITSVLTTVPGATADDCAVSLIESSTISMTCPGATADDVAPTLIESSTIAMTCPGATADDVAPTVVISSTIAMTCPGATADDVAVTSGITKVLTTVPGATADDVAVTSGITAIGTVPGATADDLALTVISSPTVAMTVPGATADDAALTITSSSTAVITTVPGATADDVAVTSAITAIGTVPGATADDVAVTPTITKVITTVPGATADDVAPTVISSPTVAMTCPGATADDLTVTAVLVSNPTVAMTVPGATADDLAVTISTAANVTVSMTCPGATADDAAITLTISSTISAPLPTATADDLAVTPSITVPMTVPAATADDLTVTSIAELDTVVPMTVPTAVADDLAVTISTASSVTISMTVPGATADDVAVTSVIVQSPTVAMTVPAATADDLTITPGITLPMSVPMATADDLAVTPIAEFDTVVPMTHPGCVADDVAVTPCVTIPMTCPGATTDDCAPTPCITVSPTAPGATADDLAVTVATVGADIIIPMSIPGCYADDLSITPGILIPMAYGVPGCVATAYSNPDLVQVQIGPDAGSIIPKVMHETREWIKHGKPISNPTPRVLTNNRRF